MTIGLRFAWRNLWRHKRRTWLTTGAMIFSNILLVFLVSWQFATYDLMINNNLRMLVGHIQLQHPQYLAKSRMQNSFAIDDKQLQTIAALPEVVVVAKRSEGFVLASSEERSYGMQIMGVEAEREANISSLPALVKTGRYLQSSSLQNDDEIEIVLGQVLATNLKVGVGDELTLFGSGRDGSTAAAIVKVVGLLASGSNELDRGLGFIHLKHFDSIFSMRGQIHRVVILTNDVDNTAQIMKKFPALGEDIALRDWNALLPELKQAIQSDMASSWFMYGVLIILVAFSVLNTQLMSVLERTREYGVMMALGLGAWRLGGYVFVETALMGALGFVLGVFLGALLVAYLGITGLTFPGMEEMAAQFNMPATVYPHITVFSAMLGPGIIFLASLFAAVYPALRLRRLHIVQAMKAP